MSFDQRVPSRLVYNTSQADLFLVGGKAIVNESRPPDVVDYLGPIYRHGQDVDTFRSSKVISDEQQRDYYDNPEFLHKQNSDIDSGVSSEASRPGKGGFFHPPSRPTSTVNGQTSSIYGRPTSGMNRPPSGSSRPPSGSSRPSSGSYRVPCVMGRPTSAARAVNNVRSPSAMTDIDPDHEPICDVLTRLGEYTNNFTPDIPITYVDCECKSEERNITSRLAKLYDSGNDSSGSDDEDHGVAVDVMLKTFQQYEDKGHTAVRHKAMTTLLDSYIAVDALSEEHFSKILFFLKNSVTQVKDACLVLLKQCAKNTTNLQNLIGRDILNFLYDCLISPTLSSVRRSALLLLEVIFSHHQFKSDWLEVATTKFLPKLLSMLRGQTALDVKYSACCVFRAFAQYEEFIVYVTEDILPSVILMRNTSAKFKEVYVEIWTALIGHTDCIPPDLVDSSAIPITNSIIREGPCGPQCAALHLLSSLTTNDTGVAMVIGTNSLVSMVLCCMKESHCRKVRLNATEVMKNLCTSRKLGLCKDLMLQLSGYLVPSLEQESLTSLSQVAAPYNVVMPTRPRFDEERQMWQGLERFIDMTKGVIFREGKVETDELGLVTKIHMKPCIDVCPVQLTILTHAFNVLQSMCLWPLDKSRLGFSANRVNLTTFTDDDKQKARLSKVNRGLTQAIWDKVGVVVTELLSSYAEKFSKVCEKLDKGRQSSLESVFESQEINLILSMLELLLCSSLCTCVAFPEILPKLVDNKSKRRSKSPSKLKSFSSSHMHTDNRSSQVESNLKSQSDVGKSFKMEDDKIWVKENPHLSNLHSHGNGGGSALEKSKAELRHKEACTERRLLRKCLYEAGVFESVCPFLLCSECHVQVLALQILRCLIQPLDERVAPKLSYTACGSTTRGNQQRPQTAGAVQNANKRLNMALYRMSPDLANLIKEALGPDTTDGGQEERRTKLKSKMLDIPGLPGDLETIQERLQDFTETSKEELKTEVKVEVEKKQEKPMIDRCRPIAQQCREALVQGTGEGLIKGIFNKSPTVKKQSVLVLHDLVHHGEMDVYMKLSTFGCMPKLVDFLRVNEDNELLEIIGLIIVRILVTSDNRLRQLFNRHGGPQLLLSMAQYTSGLLKQEVSCTLKTVSKVDTPVKRRPMSAPVMRSETKSRPPDIWDHIQARWKQEDQVKHVLRQWLETDNQTHKKK